ncbi:hypothetical protein OIE66_16700 [Nonomuraea sp. NBC_01738]|uniref:hypothetical protein n=1 Tax=Nonomuraea sp. NBC_01738 TaxID=2976003 RepID=UPI002E1516DF|nr:hypothetical protein OIE66_16700 [Nonomuraea sp. NBC_01738]
MTYAFTYDVPIGPDIYAHIKKGLGPEPPKGLVAHLAYRVGDGLRYVDVWESEADWQAFVEERLHPVVDSVLAEALGFRPPEPTVERLDMVDAWIGA